MQIESSIVIRTLNEERHLGKLLESIQQQTYKDWEIVLVDSGSTDGTLEIARRFTSNIYHIPQKEFTFGRSLNWGCEPAKGRYLVFASAHVEPLTNTWLSNLVRPFEDSSVGMVYGRQRGVATSRLAEERDLQRVFGPTSKILIDEAFGNNGNAAIRKDLWLDQPFDEELTGLEDIDWARKIQQKGYRVYYAADAAIYHIHEESLRQVYRRVFREGLAYRRIFPGFRLGKIDLVKGLAYNLAADLMYAIRSRTSLKKMAQIPATRVAGHLGLWKGLQHHTKLGKGLAAKLEYPQVSQSVVVNADGQHSLKETEVPTVGPKEILVQIAYAGVSPTDPDLAAGQTTTHYPVVPGHEFSGVVVEAGSGVTGVRKGDRIVGQRPYLKEGTKPSEIISSETIQPDQKADLPELYGSYACYLKVPGHTVYKLPSDVLLRRSALVEPLAVCLNGLKKLDVHKGANSCVIGAGPLGNFCAQLLKRGGANVTVVDSEERWLRLLHKYDVNTWENLESLDGFDYFIDTTGQEEFLSRLTAESSFPAKILLVGPPCEGSGHSSETSKSGNGQQVYTSSNGEPADWEEAIKLLQAYAINLDDHTMNVLTLESYEKAWKGVQDREFFKALLLCNRDLEWF